MHMARVPPHMFRFTTTERAEMHLAVLFAFGDANDHLETSLAFDDVRSRMRQVGFYDSCTDDELTQTLRQLTEWRHLDVVQNNAAQYATAVEYERKNLRYSLTKQGEAALDGVQHALLVLSSAGALQTAVLEAIADRLNELYELQHDDTASDRTVFNRLTELENHLEALRTNTKQFNGELARLLRDGAADVDTFREVKLATVGYLQEFVTNLDQRAQQVAEALVRVEGTGVAALHHRALRGAELPTLAHDPGPVWLDQRLARWEGLRLWFHPESSHPRINELRDIARRAIVTLMRALERLNESRRRSSSATEDFRTMARWFTSAPCDEDAHRLFNGAFGLWSARHAHLGHVDAELVTPGTAWVDAPAVPVSPLLRTRGRTEHVGRTAKVRNVGELRALRRAMAAQEQIELETAWRELSTDGTVRLSQLGSLNYSAFERLLDLVGRALSHAANPEGHRHATSADGQVEIALSPPADDRQASLVTPRGRFTGPDYRVSIAMSGGVSGAGRVEPDGVAEAPEALSS